MAWSSPSGHLRLLTATAGGCGAVRPRGRTSSGMPQVWLRKSRAPNMRVEHVTGPAEAADQVKSWLEPGDAVLIKGSNASGMVRVGTALRQMSEGAATSQKASGA